jgi:hypothetical protein
MEIGLNKEQLEEIIISLYFTGFIKDRHNLENKNPEILKFLIQKIEENNLAEFLEYHKGKPFISEKFTKNVMFLTSINDGIEVEDIDITYKLAMRYLSDLAE